jgi:hypothetical protein
METFVTKGISISISKIYTPTKEGGLGLFKLREFITALQCGWVKRCVHSINDNWKYALAKVSGGRVHLLPNDSVTQNALGSTLSEITRSYSDFKKAVSMVDNNYLKVPIYCNDSFGYDRGNGTKLDKLFFEVTGPGEHRDRLLSISWSDLIEEGSLLSKPAVENILHMVLSPEKYNALKGAYRSAVRRFHVIRPH